MSLPSLQYPRAQRPDMSSAGQITLCLHCKKGIRLSKWDNWNGFLVRCPFCERLHGKHMRPKIVLWASLFINALSFFFVVRPKKAGILAAVFLLVGLSGYTILGKEYISPNAEVVLVVVFLFLPVILNGIFILIHEANLGHSGTNQKMKVAELVSNISDLVS